MTAVHPLDHAAWSALTGRQSHLSLTRGGARRYDPAYGVFAGVADHTAATLAELAALVRAHGEVAFLEPDPPSGAPGLDAVAGDPGVQMIAARLTPAPAPAFGMTLLDDTDGPDMLALATLTRPGPFFARTHQLGDFFGVRGEDGQLIAMAGERMKPDGFTEISGVCTHPDHRGRGYARALMLRLAARIRDRGDTPFLHAYASNTAAIALYESLGFELRRHVRMVRLAARAVVGGRE